ncbi:serine hydrolase domain-containing protein [Sphingopyxis panaciterrae]
MSFAIDSGFRTAAARSFFKALFRVSAVALLASSTAIAQSPPRYNLTAITRQLDQQCADGSFSGVVVIRVAGKDIFERACGMADIVNGIANTRATRFKIYSTSKFITALVVMRLVERGKMNLDAPLATYIADVPGEWSKVTVRQLLNHSSGIPDLTVGLVERFTLDHPHAMRALLAGLLPGDRSLKTAPGSSFHYNNFGFELLADAAAQATGTPFATLIEQEIFKPAGMTTASVEAPNIVMGHPLAVNEPGLAIGYNGEAGKLEQATNYAFVQLGAGAVRATVDDFIALDAAIGAGKILSRASLGEMTRTLLPDERPDSGRQFGLGIIVGVKDGVTMQGHTGGTNGYISDFEQYPEHDAMLIALTNRGFAKTRWLREEVATMLKSAR